MTLAPYVDPRSGMLARVWDDERRVWGALKRRPLPAPEPCVQCGALTDRVAIGALCEKVKQPGEVAQDSDQMSPGSVGYGLHPSTWERIPWCDGCEQTRNLAQAARIAANPEVLPHIRERMVAYLAASEAGDPYRKSA